jgi:hypothetical protein
MLAHLPGFVALSLLYAGAVSVLAGSNGDLKVPFRVFVVNPT